MCSLALLRSPPYKEEGLICKKWEQLMKKEAEYTNKNIHKVARVLRNLLNRTTRVRFVHSDVQ